MNSNYDEAFKIVVGEEGGYVNNPRDPGGETKFGVSKKSHPTLDIKNLTIEKAKEIYRHYWDGCRCEELPWWLALPLFDCAINAGVRQTIVLLQRAVKVKEDGVFGPATLGATQKANQEKLLTEFMAQQLLFKIKLKIFPFFALGWIRRAIRITIFAAQR